MKIKLTAEQRLTMTAVFTALNSLRNDKNLMKMMEYCQTNDVNVTEENEDDVMRLANFFEDLHDYASNYFDFNVWACKLPVKLPYYSYENQTNGWAAVEDDFDLRDAQWAP